MAFKNYSNAWHDKEEPVAEEVKDTSEGTDTPQFAKVFNCEKVYLREAASKDSEPIDILDCGTYLFVESEDSDWYKVVTDDKSGYIMKKFIQICNDR